MPLFQKTVLKEFVARQNQEHIQEAYTKFQAHFGNADIQKNITAAKEEQYQEGFLKDLFVDILGYTLNPQPNFNLTTEQKNETDSKKADAAILQIKDAQQQVVAVIELKSAKTTLLQSIEYQAFGYKNHHQNCRYVITSNFTKLRFYLDNAIEFEEFDLFALTLPQFAVLYTLLHCKNLLAELPIKLKQQSIEREEELTLSFYNDYENFKDVLFLDISDKNRQIDKFTLFQKTQKLLDRIVFICFAKDKGMLPSNLIKKIIEEWETLKKFNEYKPLYYFFLKYFNYIDKGFKNPMHDIFGYNGGLFAEDEILSQLQITDQLLMNQCSYLSRYDFDSDIDVNVLGHIFEHSLNQLDAKRKELIEKAQKIELGEKPKENGKRKIDGIFYTPAYITAYMVQETVGKLCEEKKVELGLINTQIDLENEEAKEAQSTKLQNYETWLTTIRVLDPACGSGAFLNQVLTFFIAEYAWLESAKNALLPPKIEEKIEKIVDKITQEKVDIFSAPTQIPVPIEVKIVKEEKNIIHQILENNIFGVDLNEESVEITKLSLWLKTASMRQKLNNLTDNIKCGNSLIEQEDFYKDNVFDWKKPFNWQAEFPQIFAGLQAGFTVILGNPPYVRQELLGEKQKKYYSKRYTNVYHSGADLYVYFYAKALEMLQTDGLLAFITPNKWFKTQYGLGLRKLLQSYDIQHIVDFFELKIFADASTEPQIIVLKNAITTKETTNFEYFPVTKKLLPDGKIEDFAKNLTKKLSINQGNLNEEEWIFASPKAQIVLDKILGETGVKVISLEEYTEGNVYRGITTGLNKAFIIDKDTKAALIAKDARSAELIKPYAQPTAIKRWEIEDKNESFFINTGFDTEISPENYFAIYEYLQQFDKELAARQDKGKTHYNLRACVYYEEFDKPKIIYIHTAVNHYFYYDVEGFYVNNSCYLISNADVFLSAFLNSKVFQFYKKLHFVAYGNADEKGRNKLDYNKMVNVPIPLLNETQKQVFIEKVTQILLLNKELKTLQGRYLKFLEQKFPAIKISKKLTEWYLFSERDLLVELEKQKITIPMKEHYEFYDFFSVEQKNAKSVLSQTQTLENQIDKLVYALYDLSEEEIKIVEM